MQAMDRAIAQRLDNQRRHDRSGCPLHHCGGRQAPAARAAGAGDAGALGIASLDKYLSWLPWWNLIHTATLLHDDVVDESTMRRGRPTANEIVWQPGQRAGGRLSCIPGPFR